MTKRSNKKPDPTPSITLSPAEAAELQKQVAYLNEELQRVLGERRKEVEEADRLKQAMIEAAQHRHAVVLIDPDRDYRGEITAILTERLKGTADPKFYLRNGELIAEFDNFGPRFKLLISRRPLKRLRAPGSPGPYSRGGKGKRPKPSANQ